MTATDVQVRAAAVRAITATATIGTSDHDPVDISIDREIASQLPEGIAGGGGLVKAQGSLTLNDPVSPDRSVLIRRFGPWAPSEGWPPSRAQDATIDLAVDDEVAARRFTGRVSEVLGSALDTTTVKIEDRTDDFKIDFSHDAMLQTMPPPGENTGSVLNVGLRADWLANKVMRRVGFWTTPQVMGTGVVSVPAQGSMWPEMGTCGSCTQTSGFSSPGWRQAPWGWAVTNCLATYSPRNIGANNTLRGRVIAQAMMVDTANNTGRVQMETMLGSTTLMTRLTVDGYVEIRHGSNVIASPQPDAGWTRIETIWRANGTIRVHTDTGWSRDLTWTPGTTALDGAVGRTTITVNVGGRAGGFLVQFAPTSYSGGYTSQTLNATIVPGNLLAQMRAMPSITSRDGLNLLQEISESLLISLWIDEDGKLWWVHPDKMRNQVPVATLTATYDLIDLAWEDTADLARRSVTVTYLDPTIRRKADYRLTAWEGSGDNLKQGESSEEIINPPADQDWIEVSGLGQTIYCTPYPSNKQELPDFNRGIGSWVGGTHLDKDGNSPQTLIEDDPDNASTWAGKQNYPSMSRSFEKIGPAAWKLSVGLQDISDNTWVEIQQALDPVQRRTVPNLSNPVGSSINNSWTGQKMPIIRCKAITDWSDASYTSSITGPARYEEFVHDTGPWAGDGNEALADWLADQVTNPSPLVRDFPITYRTDIRLGSVVDIVEDVVYKVRLRVLVVGVSERHGEGDSQLTLTGRVISATALRWTYEQLQDYWVSRGNYDALEAADGTYEELSLPPANLSEALAVQGQIDEFRDRPRPAVLPARLIDADSPEPAFGAFLPRDTIEAEAEDVNDGRWHWPAPSNVPPVDVVGPDSDESILSFGGVS